jgi:hypothetical protein
MATGKAGIVTGYIDDPCTYGEMLFTAAAEGNSIAT